MFTQDDLLPLSGLSQIIFCERRCALMHVEGLWAENRFTAQGTLLHERVHEADDEVRGNVRIARGLHLRSLRLGLSGSADVVEFHRADPEREVKLRVPVHTLHSIVCFGNVSCSPKASPPTRPAACAWTTTPASKSSSPTKNANRRRSNTHSLERLSASASCPTSRPSCSPATSEATSTATRHLRGSSLG